MKQCKLCRSTYDDRVDFCFRDGSPLARVDDQAVAPTGPADAGVEAPPVTEEMDAPVPVAMLRGTPGRATDASARPRLPSPLPPEVDMPGVGPDRPSAEETGPSAIPAPLQAPASWLTQSADDDEEATLAGLPASVFASVAAPAGPHALAVPAPAAQVVAPAPAPVPAPAQVAPSQTPAPSAAPIAAPLPDDEDLEAPVPIPTPVVLAAPQAAPEPVKPEPPKPTPVPVVAAPEPVKAAPAAPADEFDFPQTDTPDEAPAAQPPSRSKAPMVLIALISVGVLAAAGVAILGGGGGDKPPEPPPVKVESPPAPVEVATPAPPPPVETPPVETPPADAAATAPATTTPAATAPAATADAGKPTGAATPTAAATTAAASAAKTAKTPAAATTAAPSADNPWGVESAAAASAKLSVVSAPAGARVYVDEKQVGQTPVSTDMPYGVYIVRLELDGYQATSQTVRIKEGGGSVNIKLEAVKVTGQVNIFGPPGAEVFVDERRVGAIPVITRLEEGNHTFKVVNTDGSSFSQALEIKFSNPGKPAAVHLTAP